jgi:DNA-binding response OmpR family regulator
MTEKIRVLFIEDDTRFPLSVFIRIQADIINLGLEFEDHEILPTGEYVWETVRDWKPHVIMMDHNLDNIKRNGADLIIEIRFVQNHDDTPIVFYSSEMDESLKALVASASNTVSVHRQEAHNELLAVITRIAAPSSDETTLT